MVGDIPLITVIYIDALILSGEYSMIEDYKENPAREFEMKDIGLMHYFLWLELW